MRITQGTFSFLPDLTDEQVAAQVRYALANGWTVVVEHTDDPHPRNSLWHMWAQPRFELEPAETNVVMEDLRECREAHPGDYVKLVCYDRSLGRQTSRLAFIVQRPERETAFRLERLQTADRRMRYALR